MGDQIFRKFRPARGSHLPVLIKLLSITTGPVLEMGGGMYSTPFLHWACYESKRRLVTLENNPHFMRFLGAFQSDYHDVRLVKDYAEADLSEPWAVAFVDHAPDEKRYLDILRLTHAEYVVAHDAENSAEKKYQYSKVHPFFSYRWKYNAQPKTAVFSNYHDLAGFSVL